jgi:hypothetical protein
MKTQRQYHMIYPADRWVPGDWLLVKASDAIANNGLEGYEPGTFATATTPATGARWAGTGETITVDEAISILLDTGDITVADANQGRRPTTPERAEEQAMKYRVRIVETSDNPMPTIEEMDALDHTVEVDADSKSHAGVVARHVLHERHGVDESEWATRFKVLGVDEIT